MYGDCIWPWLAFKFIPEETDKKKTIEKIAFFGQLIFSPLLFHSIVVLLSLVSALNKNAF